MMVKWQWLWIVLAVLFTSYGILVRSIGSGTRFFMVWLALGAGSLLCAALAYFDVWKKLPAFVKLILAVLFVFAAALFLIVEIQIVGCFHEKPEKNLDFLIIPGAQIYDHGPSVVLRYRLDQACEYLEDNPGTICIVSGGQGCNEPYPEAVGMRDYLTGKGIPGSRILLETEAKNTQENMKYSQELFDPEKDRVGIVTNNFHVYRACALARKSGIRHVHGISAASTPLYLPNNMLREFLGVVKDRACGNI